jgi:hypothetical protein
MSEIFFRWAGAQFYPVDFLHAKARMCEPQCQLAIVGQEQNTGRIVIEPPDRENAAFFTQASQIGRKVGTTFGIV